MVEKFFSDDIVVTYIGFSTSNGGKTRPTAVILDTEEKLIVFPITSKYANKSPKIKRQYFQIVDWKAAGLTKPSWIDIGNKVELTKKNMSLHKIGSLSLSDIKAMRKFIRSFNRISRD